jgi:hypothetical protein
MRRRFAHEFLISLRRTVVGYLGVVAAHHVYSALRHYLIVAFAEGSSRLPACDAGVLVRERASTALQEMFRRVNGVTLAAWKWR